MLRSPHLCHSNANKLPLFASAFSRDSIFIGGCHAVDLGLKSSNQASVCNRRTISNKGREHDKGQSLNVYSHPAPTQVLEEEAREMAETSQSLKTFPGQAFPLGVSEVDGGINFAVFSQHATAVTLCLLLSDRMDDEMTEVTLDPRENKTGDIWHICFQLNGAKNCQYSQSQDKLSLFGPFVPGKILERITLWGKSPAEVSFLDLFTRIQPFLNKDSCEHLDRRGFLFLNEVIKREVLEELDDLPRRNVLYCYKMDGPRGWEQGHRFDSHAMLLDPYAKLIEGRRFFGDTNDKSKFLGSYVLNEVPFDWGDDYKLPNIPEKDLVIYEMNVRAFTADESSKLDPKIRGSFLGVIEKISHLLELGINAVELLPIFEFDELEFQRHPNPRDHLINTWGYSTINFFAPMSRYASAGGGPLNASLEFKQMVKALHGAGIEVILDVVYNHTNEADDAKPYTTSFRGIDNKVYYMTDSNDGQLLNFSGCGNTLNCNHPVVMELILDSLRHWVTEYHVDGFRFDLASVLCRGTNGAPLNAPPIIRAIAKDSVLSRCKLIAEPWDCGGLYLVGRFPNWDRWAEWNGMYRDDIRRFIKGDCDLKGKFATRVSGSSDLYKVNKRKPYHSINFVVAHDGFTLRDLVSYNLKHNDANGEGGNDGSNDNLSWNCGFEGEFDEPSVNDLRSRQMKNFHLALMISMGSPMMLMGDEYGHTRLGNNNSYGHDTAINHFQWGQLESWSDHFRFVSEIIKFRRSHHHLFSRESFLGKNDVTWHEDNWENTESKFLAFTFHDKTKEDLYLAFNAHDYFIRVSIPAPPRNRTWVRVVDTNLPSPHDFVANGVSGIGRTYKVAPFSSILLKAKLTT